LETNTGPDKHGILKARLLEKYINHRVTNYGNWKDVVGPKEQTIHDRHKKYLPQIFEIVKELK
jgi:hypothetical protein